MKTLETIETQMDEINKILNDAKVNTLSELKGKTVMVTVNDGVYDNLRFQS